MSTPSPLRNVFLAVTLEGAVLAAASAVMNEAARAVPDVDWVRAEGLHITLHFFGRMAADAAPDLLGATRDAVGAAAPFDLGLEGAGRFPPGGAARVLWIGTGAGAVPLRSLAAAVHERVAAAGLPIETRPYRPHCTLGRPRRWTAAHAAAWEGVAPVRGEVQRVRRAVLLASEPRAGGSVHVPIGSLDLRG